MIDKVEVPTFLVGGEFDIFQRGTPLLFENLQKRGVPVKMIIGPWDHLEGSSGADIGRAGYGNLRSCSCAGSTATSRARGPGAPDSDIPPVTYYEQGTGTWVADQEYVDKDLHAASYRLSGSAAVGGGNGGLDAGAARRPARRRPADPGDRTLHALGQPVDRRDPRRGLADNPCLADNQLNDHDRFVFQTRR